MFVPCSHNTHTVHTRLLLPLCVQAIAGPRSFVAAVFTAAASSADRSTPCNMADGGASSSLLESLRQLHEENELLEAAAAAALEAKPTFTRGALLVDLRVSAYLLQVSANSRRAAALYADPDGLLLSASAPLTGPVGPSLNAFYASLAGIVADGGVLQQDPF